MTSSSSCFFLVLIIVLLQFSSSALASTKYIDKICGQPEVGDKEYCVQMLSAYPPAVAATSLLPLAKIVYDFGISYAVKTSKFAVEAEKHEHMHTLKTQFGSCAGNYSTIAGNLRNSLLEIIVDDDAGTASYDVMLCFDNTQLVKELVGKNSDKVSKKLMKMTLKMDKIIRILDGTCSAVGY